MAITILEFINIMACLRAWFQGQAGHDNAKKKEKKKSKQDMGFC